MVYKQIKSLVSSFLDWFDSTPFWKWFARRIIAHFTFRVFGYPSFPMADFWKIHSRLVPGRYYAFVSSDYYCLASILIRLAVGKRSRFSHAGMILQGGPEKTSVYHMMGNGLNIDHLLDLLRKQDYFAVIELDVPEEKKPEVNKRIEDIFQRPEAYKYDFEQRLGGNPYLLYCSELIYVIFKDIVESVRARTLWSRSVFDPDMVSRCGKVVYSNHPKLLETE